MRTSALAVGAAAFTVAALGAVPAMASTPESAAKSTPMCATSQLTAKLGGGDAGAGNLYRYLVLTNHSRTTCHVTGYPGLTMLNAKGKPIGAPATRQKFSYQAVVLRPGAAASDTIHTVNHQGKCLPASTKLRIYPPNNKASIVFPGKVQECFGTFSVTPFTAGTSGNPSNAPVRASARTPATASAASAPARQVTRVPKGAPDTGLAAASAGSRGDTVLVAGSAAAGVLALGGVGTAMLRRRSQG